MAVDYTIKTGDTAPPIAGTLLDANNDSVDLTGASVRFILKDKRTGDKIIDQPADVVDAVLGRVSYQWQTGDTDTADTYNAEFEVHWLDGTYETFPNSKYITVKFLQDLGGNVG